MPNPLTSNLSVPGFALRFFELLQTRKEAPAGRSFPRFTGQTLEQFEGDREEFRSFAGETISRFNVLREFIRNNASSGEAKEALEGFNLLQERLFNPDNFDYGRSRAVLFGNGKETLDQIVGLITGKTGLGRYLDAVLELGRNIKACPSGAAINLTQTLNRLRPNDEAIPRLKDEMTTQLIIEFLQKAGFKLYRGQMEAHYVTAIKNILAGKLGLKIQPDRLADNCGITQEHIDACERYIEPRLTPLAMARAVAEECLSEFIGTMRSNFEKTGNTLQSFDCRRVFEQVQTAIAPLTAKCGDDDVHPFITQIDPDDAQFWRINNDPTLLILKILQADNVLGPYVTEPFKPEEIFRHPGHPIDTCIMHHKGMIWATEKGEAHLLESRHLKGIPPHRLGNKAGLAITTAVKNSTPLDLLQNLPSSWLADTTVKRHLPSWLGGIDIRQLVAKLKGEALTLFLKKHARVLDHLPSAKRLELAEVIIADGNPQYLHLSKVDAQTLFSGADGAATSVRQRFAKAIQSNDADLIAALGEVLLRAEKPAAAPFLKALFPSSEAKVAPLLDYALKNASSPAVVTAFCRIAMRAADMKYISPARLVDTLSGSLLGALTRDNADAVKRLGRGICHAYKKGIVNIAYVKKFLIGNASNGDKLFKALAYGGPRTQYAFSALLMNVENIKREKEGAAFTYLSLPKPPPRTLLSTVSSLKLGRARTSERLVYLRAELNDLARQLAAKGSEAFETTGLRDRINARIWTSRLGLYLAPGNIRKEKEQIFSGILDAWKTLDPLLPPRPMDKHPEQSVGASH